MKPTRLPLPALHLAVVLLWAALLGASAFLVRSGRDAGVTAHVNSAPAPVLLPVQGSAGLLRCADEAPALHAKRREPRGKLPEAALLSDATRAN